MSDIPVRSVRTQRVLKNLKQGMALAWAASLKSLIRYSVLGIISAAGVQRAISAYSGYGRNLFVLRVQLEA